MEEIFEKLGLTVCDSNDEAMIVRGTKDKLRELKNILDKLGFSDDSCFASFFPLEENNAMITVAGGGGYIMHL